MMAFLPLLAFLLLIAFLLSLAPLLLLATLVLLASLLFVASCCCRHSNYCFSAVAFVPAGFAFMTSLLYLTTLLDVFLLL
jgi:hypothetical protein